MKDVKTQVDLTKKSSDTLMNKAKKQLDEALQKNDLQAAHVARGMMSASENMKKEEPTIEVNDIKIEYKN